MKKPLLPVIAACALAFSAVALVSSLMASSHREAPFITEIPKVDGTDFYFFQGYDANGLANNDTTILIMNFHPLQDPFGGPNYFFMDEEALYEINIDNTGDALPDIRFSFTFDNIFNPATVTTDDLTVVQLPFVFNPGGQITVLNDPDLVITERYSFTIAQGGPPMPAGNVTLGGTQFYKPIDNIADDFLPNYPAYAAQHIFEFDIPTHPDNGRVFVGQRDDPFFVNLGDAFDVVGPIDRSPDNLAVKNVTSFVIEVPTDFLTNGGANPIVGAWSVARTQQTRILNPAPTNPDNVILPPPGGDPIVQVSRLGMPLVNEIIIGLGLKDRFNTSQPANDAAQFLVFFTNPSIAELVGVPSAGRNDVRRFYLTGLPGLNELNTIGGAEMLRLNTAVPPVALAAQHRLGYLGGDNAGYPNGRRPADDVVDITLQVLAGILLPNPAASQVNDGVVSDPGDYLSVFPYLANPIAGDAAIACTTLECSVDLVAPFVTEPNARFNAGNRTYTVTKPASASNYYRVRSNIKVAVDNVQIVGPDVKIKFGKSFEP